MFSKFLSLKLRTWLNRTVLILVIRVFCCCFIKLLMYKYCMKGSVYWRWNVLSCRFVLLCLSLFWGIRVLPRIDVIAKRCPLYIVCYFTALIVVFVCISTWLCVIAYICSMSEGHFHRKLLFRDNFCHSLAFGSCFNVMFFNCWFLLPF